MALEISRRSLLVGGGVVAASFLVGGMASALQGGHAIPLRPPSAQDEVRFHAVCLKCDRCRSACPMGCIRAGLFEDGLIDYRTPILDFRRGHCTFCGRCAVVCPTGAITRTDCIDDRIGLAEVDKERCIAWLLGSCRVCADVCPYDAVSLDESGRPVIDGQACNGCGLCEYKCPSSSYRSFTGGTKRGVTVVRGTA